MSFLVDALSCATGEMSHNRCALIDQPCKVCNAPLMKHNDASTDNNICAATSLSSDLVIGQCVNAECLLSYGAQDTNDDASALGDIEIDQSFRRPIASSDVVGRYFAALPNSDGRHLKGDSPSSSRDTSFS